MRVRKFQCATLGVTLATAAFICVAKPPLAATRPVRDWIKFPVVVELSSPRILYAVGDIHGDCERLTDLLLATKLVTRDATEVTGVCWNGKDATLVCTGDVIDKYPHGLEVIALFRALQMQAPRTGGRVIVTMGNHEAEFLASGGANHKSAEFVDELTKAHLVPADVAAGDDAEGIGKWLRDLPIAAEVGDWFLCHAGDTHGDSIHSLDQQIATDVNANGFMANSLIGSDSILEARMHPRPWWEWNGKPPQLERHVPKSETSDAGESRLRDFVAELGCHHLVFGHQPGEIKFADGTRRAADDIAQKFDGLVFFIDTGMSRGVDAGRAGLLRIVPGDRPRVSADFVDGKTELLLR